MTCRVQRRIVLIASLILLLSFAGIRPSAAQSGLPYWTEIQQGGAVPDALWDGASAYHDGLFYIFGGLNGTFPNDEPVADFSVFDVDTLTWYDLGQYPGGPSARAESMMWCVAEDDAVIVSGGRGPFRRGLDLTHQDTFRFDPVHGWTQMAQSAAEIGRANRSTEAVAVRKKGKQKTVAYAFSGSSSTLPAFINRPDGLQHDLVRYKNGWKQVATGSPAPRARAHHPLIYSEGWNALFVYGGYTNDAVNGTGLFTPENYLGDLWKLDLDTETWHQLVFNEAGGPGHRDNAKLIADEQQRPHLALRGQQVRRHHPVRSLVLRSPHRDLDARGHRDDGAGAGPEVRPVLLHSQDRHGLRALHLRGSDRGVRAGAAQRHVEIDHPPLTSPLRGGGG